MMQTSQKLGFKVTYYCKKDMQNGSVLEQDEKPQLSHTEVIQAIRAMFTDANGIVSKRGTRQIVS